MKLYTGEIDAKVDAKGRVFVPAVFRRQFDEGERERIVLAPDTTGLFITFFPMSAWNARVHDLKSRLNEWDDDDRLLLMQVMADATLCDIDSQGRVLVPKALLQEFGIGNDVKFVGMIDRFALWSVEGYMEFKQKSRAELGRKLSERLK